MYEGHSFSSPKFIHQLLLCFQPVYCQVQSSFLVVRYIYPQHSHKPSLWGTALIFNLCVTVIFPHNFVVCPATAVAHSYCTFWTVFINSPLHWVIQCSLDSLGSPLVAIPNSECATSNSIQLWSEKRYCS